MPRDPGDRARGIGAQPLPLAGQVRSLKGRLPDRGPASDEAMGAVLQRKWVLV